MASNSLLSNYTIAGPDPDRIASAFEGEFGAARLDKPGDADVRLSMFKLPGSRIFSLECDGPLSIELKPGRCTRQLFNIEGSGRYFTQEMATHISPGATTAPIDCTLPLRLDVEAGYRDCSLVIDEVRSEQVLESLVQESITAPIRFTGKPTWDAGELRKRVFELARDLNIKANYLSEWSLIELDRRLIADFLICNENNYSNLLFHAPASAAPTIVRRVEEYVDANWDKPLDMATLAGVANLSARSLLRQFMRVRRYSPTEFVKITRLRRAKEMLSFPKTTTTVTEIGLKCGFHNLGHFARDYKTAFGELPSETLGNGRGSLNPVSPEQPPGRID